VSSASISACLIVKNEERLLADCLESIQPIVDEIVVLDTGSKDRTMEIALSFGARVFSAPWTDDFAEARNRSLDLARGDWILHIDADERLRRCSPAKVRSLLGDDAKVAYFVQFHQKRGYTACWEPRLFRNRREIRFRGAFHEHIRPGLEDFREKHGGNIGESPLVMDHVGYEGNQTHKHRRNIPLLLKTLRQHPTNFYNWCHLGMAYKDLGRHRKAEAALETALEIVRRWADAPLLCSFPYVCIIRIKTLRWRNTMPLLEEAVARFPENYELVWLKGRALMCRRRYAEASVCFQRLIARGRAKRQVYGMPYYEGIFHSAALEALATCQFKLGEYSQSAKSYALAAGGDTPKLRLRVKSAIAARLAAESRDRYT
jgi:glycosyltransferase involved in cell wall biosynthesis